MPPRKDLTGVQFGLLIARKRVRGSSPTRWWCDCKCGRTVQIPISGLTVNAPHRTSCGCRGFRVKHGMSFTGRVAPEYRLWIGAHARAKTKHLPFNIKPQDIKIPKRCPLLGIPLFTTGKRGNPNSPSVDRIIPRLGYVVDNIWVVSYKANRVKGDLTLNEMKRLVKNWERRTE